MLAGRMAIFVAVLSTISIGIGEFFASDATERARSQEVSSMMLLSGVVLTGVVALAWPGEPSTRDLMVGGLAGVANGVGILLLYAAYSRGSLRSAAPSAAVVMTAIPVLWAVWVNGESPSAVAWLGITLGLVAIGLSSYQPPSNDGGPGVELPGGLSIAILAGVVFGVLIILLGEIEDGAGGSPLVVQRVAGLIVAVTVTRATGPRVFPADRSARLLSLVVGLFATGAVVLFVLALELGASLSVTSVLSSQYAGVAVLLAFVFRGQKLLPTQAAGLLAASVAVALITLG